jgi:hypothetical protein
MTRIPAVTIPGMIPGMSRDIPNTIDVIFSNVWDIITFLTIRWDM